MNKPKVPTYGHHKPTGQARCYVNGKTVYLGKYGTEESRIRYGQVVAQVVGGTTADPFVAKPGAPQNGPTVNELVLAFMRHADQHYRKDGKPTSEIHCMKAAIRPLVELYGFNPVDEFGPTMLKAVRQKYVDSGWVRKTSNKSTGRIRSIFRWGVENELVSPATLQKLKAVAPLLAGRSEAKDNPARTPATAKQIEAVRPHVSQLVRDLIDVQRLTGARAGELLKMTPEALDTSDTVWLFDVDGHKTEHHGHSRVIAIGEQAQAILIRRMKKLKNQDRVFKMRRDSYTTAVRRACQKLKVEPCTPHQLRHALGHQVRGEFGLEHVQATLGHADFSMSERYAKVSIFVNYLQSIHFGPNPSRNRDDSLSARPTGMSALDGERIFMKRLDVGREGRNTFRCVDCHMRTNGADTTGFSGLIGQSTKVAQLRGLKERIPLAGDGTRVGGFGFSADGSKASLSEFLADSHRFQGITEQDKAALESFLLSFPTETPPIVGFTCTVHVSNRNEQSIQSDVALLREQAQLGNCLLSVTGLLRGERIELVYDPASGLFRDRLSGNDQIELKRLISRIDNSESFVSFVANPLKVGD